MLPRTSRLRNPREFRAVYSTGQAHVHRLVVLHVCAAETGVLRIGFSIGKRVGGSVTRNRVKRRLREVMRARLARLSAGHDLVWVARSASARAPLGALAKAVDALLERSGLVPLTSGEGIGSCDESVSG